MECKVVDVRKVSTRFGERLLLTVDHPEVREIWLNGGSESYPVGSTVHVEKINNRWQLVKDKKAKRNGDDAVAELVDLFKVIRDALPDESSEAIAKLAITLFLRK